MIMHSNGRAGSATISWVNLADTSSFDKEPQMAFIVRSSVRWGVPALVVATVVAVPALARAADKPVTFSKDVAPIFQAKCQSCHEPGSIAPMSLSDLPGSASLGQVDPGARRGASDAAVAHRPQRRRPEVQERHVAHRRADRHDRRRGSIRARSQGNPADMPPLKPVDDDAVLAGRARRLRAARPRREVAGVHDAGGEPGSVVAPDRRHPRPHRAALGADGRNPADATSRAARSCITRSRTSCWIRTTRTPTRSTAASRAAAAAGADDPQDLVNARPTLMEWAIGKGYDRYLDGTGKLIKPGEKIHWDQHVHAVGEEVTAGSELGIWLYPKGQEPKHRSYLIGFTGLKNGAGRPRHPAQLDRAHRRLHGAEGKHRHHQLPAALPSARQGDAGRSDSARRRRRRSSATSTTSTSTG